MSRLSDSSLLRAAEKGEATVYAVFGGQGNTDYFSQIQTLHESHLLRVDELLEKSTNLLNLLLKRVGGAETDVYTRSLDVRTWLADPESLPPLTYLLSAPVSVPLIGLAQLMQYAFVCEKLGVHPGALGNRLAGATGHSQGIVTAAAIASAHSWESFLNAAIQAIEVLFWIGFRVQTSGAQDTLPQSTLHEASARGDGIPTPMMAISDLSQTKVQRAIENINQHLPSDKQLAIALVNGRHNTVVSGPPASLHGLATTLRAENAASGRDQTRIPFSKRKGASQFQYLRISAPFHSDHLAAASSLIEQDLAHLKMEPRSLMIPVYHTRTGEDIGRSTAADLIPDLVSMVTLEQVDWPLATTFPRATHIIDFGPGALSGAGMLTHKIKDGRGVRVLFAQVTKEISTELGNQAEILEEHWLRHAVSWYDMYKPRLFKNAADIACMDTKMTRVLGLPPIMIAGMTPTTVPWDFVAATMNAGFHIELAGGGYYNAKAMREAVVKIQDATSTGRQIAVNLIYASPASMQWQIPLIRDLNHSSSGPRIAGLTIGAGVPSLEVANNYISTLGLRYISFKPSSVESIEKVLEIARANPEFPVMLQWTGGRGGGHHSYEDFHSPILVTYSQIRKCENVVLVAGSGFGGSEDTYPYLNGSWSEMLGYAAMPFDGCLFGSRMMVAKEAHTSKGAKEAIVKSEGVADNEWEKTYQGAAGNIITVRSEMGEPIHKIATRGVLFWAEMDKTIFSLDRSKRSAELTKRRDHIIRNLNLNFQKPWFPTVDGVAMDLQDMVYAEVINRMVELMFIKSLQKWIDPSYQRLTADFIQRMEDRLASPESASASILESLNLSHRPQEALVQLFAAYPQAHDQILSAEDARYFLELCQRRGQKPAPFVPVLDENFETWFKKDSLWQSEFEEAVPDQDIGRTCILQGPVAVRYAKLVDEPIKEILGNINEDHVAFVLREEYGGQSDLVPAQIQPTGHTWELPLDIPDVAIERHDEGKLISYTIGGSSTTPLPSEQKWLQMLAGPPGSSRHAFFTSQQLIQDCSRPNPYLRMFSPRRGISVCVGRIGAGNQLVCLSEESKSGEYVTAVDICFDLQNNITVDMVATDTASGLPAALRLEYTYHSDNRYAPIRENMSGRNERINDFYRRCWFDVQNNAAENDEVYIDGEDVSAFKKATKNTSRSTERNAVPTSYAIKLAWKSIMGTLFTKVASVDLLKLVHLSNTYSIVPGGPKLTTGQTVRVSAYVKAILNQDSGKMVSVKADIKLGRESAIRVTSNFFYRGNFDDFENTFEKRKEAPRALLLGTVADAALLKSKSWARLKETENSLVGAQLVFRMDTAVRYKNKDQYSKVDTVGTIIMEPSARIVGTVDYHSGESTVNEALDYLNRVGTVRSDEKPLDNAIPLHGDEPLIVKAPLTNESYAFASGDFNPIHTLQAFSNYANLPGTITHGMYISSVMQGFVETIAADGDADRVKMFHASFVGMVLPGDELEVELFHVAMTQGHQVIKIEAVNKASQEKVFSGNAEVAPPVTAFIFSGQGSQEMGMGMELRSKSPAARKVWDQADKFLSETYGVLISEIVRTNPKELTVYFRGQRGRQLRDNYTKLSHDVYDRAGNLRTKKLFPGIDEFTTSYTYRSPTGLLFSTQFAQPALTILEKASIEDMKSKGLVSNNSMFAGHSLGEYSALAALAEAMPIEKLIAIVFYRGLTMQNALERDSAGRSNYAMVAVDPSRLSPTFGETALKYVVERINRVTGNFFEIVNLNVEGKQYVCTGELAALDCLQEVLDLLKARNIDLSAFLTAMPAEQLNETFDPMVSSSLDATLAKPKPLVLRRGAATIPLPGVDVPFHSSFFRPQMDAFRKALLTNLDPKDIKPERLIGKYVPNLIAKPFSIDKEYFEEIYDLTASEKIAGVLESWPDAGMATA